MHDKRISDATRIFLEKFALCLPIIRSEERIMYLNESTCPLQPCTHFCLPWYMPKAAFSHE